MMTKGRRAVLYILGFGIGCVLAYFMLFKGKNRTYWFPSNRVRDQIAKSAIHFTEHSKCLMQCYSVSENEIKEVLKNGDVSFSESQTHATPCPVYMIENDSMKISCKSCDSTSEVLDIHFQNEVPCNCQ